MNSSKEESREREQLDAQLQRAQHEVLLRDHQLSELEGELDQVQEQLHEKTQQMAHFVESNQHVRSSLADEQLCHANLKQQVQEQEATIEMFKSMLGDSETKLTAQRTALLECHSEQLTAQGAHQGAQEAALDKVHAHYQEKLAAVPAQKHQHTRQALEQVQTLKNGEMQVLCNQLAELEERLADVQAGAERQADVLKST